MLAKVNVGRPINNRCRPDGILWQRSRVRMGEEKSLSPVSDAKEDNGDEEEERDRQTDKERASSEEEERKAVIDREIHNEQIEIDR